MEKVKVGNKYIDLFPVHSSGVIFPSSYSTGALVATAKAIKNIYRRALLSTYLPMELLEGGYVRWAHALFSPEEANLAKEVLKKLTVTVNAKLKDLGIPERIRLGKLSRWAHPDLREKWTSPSRKRVEDAWTEDPDVQK